MVVSYMSIYIKDGLNAHKESVSDFNASPERNIPIVPTVTVFLC